VSRLWLTPGCDVLKSLKADHTKRPTANQSDEGIDDT